MRHITHIYTMELDEAYNTHLTHSDSMNHMTHLIHWGPMRHITHLTHWDPTGHINTYLTHWVPLRHITYISPHWHSMSHNTFNTWRPNEARNTLHDQIDGESAYVQTSIQRLDAIRQQAIIWVSVDMDLDHLLIISLICLYIICENAINTKLYEKITKHRFGATHC